MSRMVPRHGIANIREGSRYTDFSKSATFQGSLGYCSRLNAGSSQT